MPPPATVRWTVLVLLSLAMFGNYYAYDAIGPLADQLSRELGFTNTQIGTLNAIYSLPNVVMVLVGGILVDRLGTRRATLYFTAVCCLGALITALSPRFPIMAAGRLIFGLGAESMIVAVTAALGQWFVGRQLGFAFGVNLSIARFGSYAADLSPTWARSFYDGGWQPPLLLAAAMCAVGLVAAVGYFLVERVAERRYELGRVITEGRVVLRGLLRFDRSYWYVTGICVAFYAVIFPFRSTFAIAYFQHAHGLSLQEAGALNGHVFLAAIFATPAFGLLVDRVGRRALFMVVGSLMLFAVFPILVYAKVTLWVSTVLVGIAFSLVPAALWPSIPLLVEPARLGTAYGLMTALQNIGMMIMNLVVGALNDANHAGPGNPAGYVPMLWLFAGLSLVGLLLAIALRMRETGPRSHGLEERGRPG